MKKNTMFCSLILNFFFLFLSCQQTIKIENGEKFINTWKATKKPTPFTGTLKIKQNNTFEYFAGACTSKSFSEGKWEVNNDTIILNSFLPQKCYFLWEFEFNCDSLPIKGKSFEIKKSIKDCEPNSEEDYTVFKNVKFYLKDTILVHKRKLNNNCLTKFGEFNNNFILIKNGEK